MPGEVGLPLFPYPGGSLFGPQRQAVTFPGGGHSPI